MTEWSVEADLKIPLGESEEQAEELIDELLDVMEPHAPAVRYRLPDSLSVRFCVTEKKAKDAIWKGLELLSSSLRKAHFPERGDWVRVEAETMADLDRRIQESNAPEIVGVSELAELLGVTRQRASELARSRDFPLPIATLASGPVWRKSSVARFVEHWPRRPGRPKKVEVGGEVVDMLGELTTRVRKTAVEGTVEPAGSREKPAGKESI